MEIIGWLLILVVGGFGSAFVFILWLLFGGVGISSPLDGQGVGKKFIALGWFIIVCFVWSVIIEYAPFTLIVK